MIGHTIEKCFKKHGYPPGWVAGYKSKNRQQQDRQSASINQVGDIGISADQLQRLMTFIQNQNQCNQPSTSAAVTVSKNKMKSEFKNSATDHITCSLEYFENYHKVHGISVKLPNGETMSVTHIGEIRLHLNLLLTNVLWPSWDSVDGFAKESNGLYLITDPPARRKNDQTDGIAECNSLSLELWHHRLGHYPVNKIHLLNGIKPTHSCKFSDFACDACHFAKHKRLPTTKIGEKTPFETLYGKDVSYDHLKIFECLCYCSTISQGRNTMQTRARKCIFLGIPANVKGYLLYDIANKNVFVSRDVLFVEQIYPLKESQSGVNLESSEAEIFNLVLPLIPITTEMATTSLEVTERVDSPTITPNNDDDMSTNININNELAIEANSEPIVEERLRNVPTRLHDYYCQSMSTNQSPTRTSPHSISMVISYENLSPNHRICASSILSSQEP
ncbi:uncharacterized protein LOC116015990 [Ipomoea triloba]|uniref:uncharacterized protein LOC116015990 n=1 Tax=Ipomoea triloba TaxID=35885 RepID=UPI00125E383F|nr:uncharacterized protein LOC116015990 [Ipomoea triloba]